MTPDQLRRVESLIALAGIEMQVRVLRAVADALQANEVHPLLYGSLRLSADTIERSLAQIVGASL